jgi:hypothetical protein
MIPTQYGKSDAPLVRRLPRIDLKLTNYSFLYVALPQLVASRTPAVVVLFKLRF